MGKLALECKANLVAGGKCGLSSRVAIFADRSGNCDADCYSRIDNY